MSTATGTLQFPSVIPRLLFSKEVGEGRDGRDESNTTDFYFKEMASMCVCLCVYVFCVLFCHDSNFLLSTKVCSNTLS